MRHLFVPTFLLLFSLIKADHLAEYTRISNAVYSLVDETQRALPGHQWPARFKQLRLCLDEDVIPCSSLKYLVEGCRAALCQTCDKKTHNLKQLTEECIQMLSSVCYEMPELSSASAQTYRACCKHRRCLIIDKDLTVGGITTTNNLVVTGASQFLNTPLGPILGYAYLYSQNEADETVEPEDVLEFRLVDGTSRFRNSAEFSISETAPGSNIANGINIPAGTYLFYWKVAAINTQTTSRVPILLELFSTTPGTVIAGTKFSSDNNALADPASIYAIVDGMGIIVAPQATTLQILNLVGQNEYFIPQLDAVQKSINLVRIQT